MCGGGPNCGAAVNSKRVNAPLVSSPTALMVYRSAANHSDLPSVGGRTLTLWPLPSFSLGTLLLSFLPPKEFWAGVALFTHSHDATRRTLVHPTKAYSLSCLENRFSAVREGYPELRHLRDAPVPQ